MHSSSARQTQQTKFLCWQDIIFFTSCLSFSLAVVSSSQQCVHTCSAVHLRVKAVLKQQVFGRIKVVFPFKFLLLSRQQLLIFYLSLCSFSAR